MAKNRLILTGQMRSGTTMLSAFLNAQKGFVVFPDTLRVSAASLSVFGPGNDPDRVLGGTERKRLFTTLSKLVLKRKGEVTANKGHMLELAVFERLAERNEIPAFATEAEFYSVMLDLLAAEAEIGPERMFGTKATRAEDLARSLAAQGMKAVIILRDPRAVYLSIVLRASKDATFNTSTDLDAFTAAWARAFAVWADPGQALAIRYEDFLKDDAEIARMSDYFGRPLDANVKIVTANSSFGDKSTGQRRPEALDRWRTHGNPADMARIAEVLKPQMERAGYL